MGGAIWSKISGGDPAGPLVVWLIILALLVIYGGDLTAFPGIKAACYCPGIR